MTTRKIILFGKNSYVISLPKNWIQRNKIKKGDEVTIEETYDMLVVSSSTSNSQEEIKIKKIYAGENNQNLERSIISAYINNYNMVEIIGENLIDKFDFIRNSTQELVAFEIMELGPKKVIIKDFLNTSDIFLDTILRRIDMIIRAMITEVKESFFEGESVNLDTRDKDINRLFYVANKILNKLLSNPKLSKELNIPLNDVLFKWRVLVSFEEIGDQLKRINRVLLEFLNFDKKKQILEPFDEVCSQYQKCIKSFTESDKEKAFEILNDKKKILTKIESLIGVAEKFCSDSECLTKVVLYVEKLKRFESAICHIAKSIVTNDN